jgi:hypothetical protein
MKYIHNAVDYPGRIKNIHEVASFNELVEYFLPYGLAKVYMTANRRWIFLDKNRRKKALSIMLNRVIRRFTLNIWDIRITNIHMADELHTTPVIGIIEALITEYAQQKGCMSKGENLCMALFRLCGRGLITTCLKNSIETLHQFKTRKEQTGAYPSDSGALFNDAVKTLYVLEEQLLDNHRQGV